MSVAPDRIDELRARFDTDGLRSRHVELAAAEDDMEAMFDRGWSDGLPVVPPTRARVLAMLEGTSRPADDIVAVVAPNLVECTVEKVAINAVLAGCKPEYLPFVLASVEAACSDGFNMHGLIATTWQAGPMIVASGPLTTAIGMNSGRNAMGQGNRANATIGRAVQLVIRNVGGGRPGEIDRATLGNPGKLSFCFAERVVDGPDWPTQAIEHGIEATDSAVTLFGAEGTRGVIDQISREPVSLVKSFAASLRTVASVKLALAFDAAIVISPEHLRVFREAGWTKAQFRQALDAELMIPGAELTRGFAGIDEGMPAGFEGIDLPKFRPDGLLIFHAGGDAGLFSNVVGGWVGGDMGSSPVSASVEPWR